MFIGNVSFEGFFISYGKHFFLQFLPFLQRKVFILLLFQPEIFKVLSRGPRLGPEGPCDNQSLSKSIMRFTRLQLKKLAPKQYFLYHTWAIENKEVLRQKFFNSNIMYVTMFQLTYTSVNQQTNIRL